MTQLRGLKANFWVANWMEANERLAFFGVRAIAPLYMIAATTQNGLALSYTEKGLIYTIWALIQCLVPMVSGGFTDEYGYKKSLFVAFGINICGYLAFAFASGNVDSLGPELEPAGVFQLVEVRVDVDAVDRLFAGGERRYRSELRHHYLLDVLSEPFGFLCQGQPTSPDAPVEAVGRWRHRHRQPKDRA